MDDLQAAVLYERAANAIPSVEDSLNQDGLALEEGNGDLNEPYPSEPYLPPPSARNVDVSPFLDGDCTPVGGLAESAQSLIDEPQVVRTSDSEAGSDPILQDSNIPTEPDQNPTDKAPHTSSNISPPSFADFLNYKIGGEVVPVVAPSIGSSALANFLPGGGLSNQTLSVSQSLFQADALSPFSPPSELHILSEVNVIEETPALLNIDSGETVFENAALPYGVDPDNYGVIDVPDEEYDEDREQYSLVTQYFDTFWHDSDGDKEREEDEGMSRGTLRGYMGAYVAKLKRLIKQRSVSQFWTEKLLIFIDYLQIFSLLWIMCQRFYWPYWFSRWTGAILYANVDLVAYNVVLFARSFTDERSSVGFAPDPFQYPRFCLIWLSVPLVGVALYVAIGRAFHYHHIRLRSLLQQLILVGARLLYVPCALVYFRIALCKNQIDALHAVTFVFRDFEAGSMCWEPRQAFPFCMQIIATCLCLAYMVGFPFWYFRNVQKELVYETPQQHEMLLKWKETAYVLRLDGRWALNHFHLFSSFRYEYVYYNIGMMGLKLFLVAVYYVMGPAESRRVDLLAAAGAKSSSSSSADAVADDDRFRFYQALAVFLVASAFLVFHSLASPFRCVSTNMFLVPLTWANVVNLFAGFVLSRKPKNSLFLDRQVIIWLSANHAIALLCCLLIVAFSILRREGWPVTSDYARRIAVRSEPLITFLRRVRNIQTAYRLRIPELRPRHGVVQLIEECSMLRMEAAYGRSHPLHRALEDAMDDLFVLQNDPDAHLSVLPYPPLEGVLKGWAGRVGRRWEDFATMVPWKRRVLLKLLALRCLTRPIRSSIPYDYGLCLGLTPSMRLNLPSAHLHRARICAADVSSSPMALEEQDHAHPSTSYASWPRSQAILPGSLSSDHLLLSEINESSMHSIRSAKLASDLKESRASVAVAFRLQGILQKQIHKEIGAPAPVPVPAAQSQQSPSPYEGSVSSRRRPLPFASSKRSIDVDLKADVDVEASPTMGVGAGAGAWVGFEIADLPSLRHAHVHVSSGGEGSHQSMSMSHREEEGEISMRRTNVSRRSGKVLVQSPLAAYEQAQKSLRRRSNVTPRTGDSVHSLFMVGDTGGWHGDED